MIASSSGLWSQLCTVNGVVKDALTGEALIGAYVKSGNAVVATDFDGKFALPVPKGETTLEVSYIGYDSQTKEVKCEGASTSVTIRMETLIMKEAVVSADVVISRKTPVAFTNVLPAQIQEGTRRARFAIGVEHHPWGVPPHNRVAVMEMLASPFVGLIKPTSPSWWTGVPMNDMENGWVYWSNWAGLDLVVRTHTSPKGTWSQQARHPLCWRDDQHFDRWRRVCERRPDLPE